MTWHRFLQVGRSVFLSTMQGKDKAGGRIVGSCACVVSLKKEERRAALCVHLHACVRIAVGEPQGLQGSGDVCI